MWRPKRSKSNQTRTFEEQKMIAEGTNTLGATMASAGSLLGGWLTSVAAQATGQTQPE